MEGGSKKGKKRKKGKGFVLFALFALFVSPAFIVERLIFLTYPDLRADFKSVYGKD